MPRLNQASKIIWKGAVISRFRKGGVDVWRKPAITITSPATGASYYTDETSPANISISVNWVGNITPTGIQARHNGAAWTNIISSPTGNSGTGTLLNVPVGTGLLEVRFANNPEIVASVSNIIVATASPSPSPTPGPGTGRMAVFGDSLTTGAGATTTANRWANRVSTATTFTLLNAGISGTVLQNSPDANGSPRANNGRDRFQTAILGSNQSEHNYILYGLNDLRYTGATASVNVSNYTNDYKEIINGLLLAGCDRTKIRVGLPWIPDAGYNQGSTGFTGSTRVIHESYLQAVKDVASEYGLLYAPVYENMLSASASQSIMDTDNVHPNNTGHSIIAVAFQNAAVNNTNLPARNLAAVSNNPNQLTLTWLAPTSGTPTEYEVQIATTGSLILGNPVTVTGFTHTYTGLSAANYVGRVRPKYSDNAYGPWLFIPTASAVTVANASPSPSPSPSPYIGLATFNGVAETTLPNYTPEIGTFTRLPYSTSGAGDARISTANRGKGSATSNSTVYYSLVSLTSDSFYGECLIDVLTNTSGQLAAGIILKAAATGATPNLLAAWYNGQNIRLFKNVNSTTPVQLGTTHTIALTGNGHLMRFECTKTTDASSNPIYRLRVLLNGTQIIGPVDEPEANLVSLGTLAGVRFQNGSTTSASNTTGPHLDEVRFGNI